MGGGPGTLLRAILEAAPELSAVLVDRAGAVSERLAATGLAGRVECVAGDFFDSVPAGADAYLLSRVLPTGTTPTPLVSWRPAGTR